MRYVVRFNVRATADRAVFDQWREDAARGAVDQAFRWALRDKMGETSETVLLWQGPDPAVPVSFMWMCPGCGHTYAGSLGDQPAGGWDNPCWVTLRDAPDGAMWDATWYPDQWKGPDGRFLVVKCPGGSDWAIDGRASNCTMPDDTQHRCWVRHGEPPLITVGKDGVTCQAGGGSIQTGNYHGFLRNGVFDP